MQDIGTISLLREARPNPIPSVIAKDAARVRLKVLIESDSTSTSRTPRLPKKRGSFTVPFIAAAAAALILIYLTAGGKDLEAAPYTLTANQTPTEALRSAGQAVAAWPRKDSGTIRYVQFRNYSDPGQPVYARYLLPDGSGWISTNGGPLEKIDADPTTASFSNLPSDPSRLRPAMIRLAKEREITSQWDESVNRGLIRLSVVLLTDPAVGPRVSQGIYEVLAAISDKEVKARNLGLMRDLEGRPGLGLEFTFAEGARETLVIDRTTGSILSDSTKLHGVEFSGQSYLDSKLVVKTPQASTR